MMRNPLGKSARDVATLADGMKGAELDRFLELAGVLPHKIPTFKEKMAELKELKAVVDYKVSSGSNMRGSNVLLHNDVTSNQSYIHYTLGNIGVMPVPGSSADGLAISEAGKVVGGQLQRSVQSVVRQLIEAAPESPLGGIRSNNIGANKVVALGGFKLPYFAR
jgi:hypothetical protein